MRPIFAEAIRRNLRHEGSAHPFYPLDPAREGAPGYRWWNGKTGPLIRECGRHAVASALLYVELFPYHLRSFGAHKLQLPSQEYSATLVQRAIARGAFIVMMRAKRHWLERVPDLRAYTDAQPQRVAALNSPQNVTISPRNLPEGVFATLVQAICAHNAAQA